MPPALPEELERYAQALDALEDARSGTGTRELLTVLQARDRVEAAREVARPITADQARCLIDLDERLRKRGTHLRLEELPVWRQSLRPPEAAWWWSLDREVEEQEKKRDMPWTWVALTGLLVLLTLTLTAEVLKRLWSGAPDAFSVLGTLLTLALSASPLFERGQDLAWQAMDYIPRLKPRLRSEAMVGMAALAFAIVLAGRLLLPQLAVVYNDRGFASLASGDLTSAQRKFQRAVALDPDLVAPYHNLADVYRQIQRPEEARTWYQRAIEHDLDFALAYHGLGHLYNEEGEHEQAIDILLVGLQRTDGRMSEKMSKTDILITRYRLLSELGRAYFAQEEYDLAQAALEEAVGLETQLERQKENEGSQYLHALPHYYLAQIYERLDRLTEAHDRWEDCLRLLKPGWMSEDWRVTANKHLENLEGEIK
jgi:tetratricopeptide (TPR) repeat protein